MLEEFQIRYYCWLDDRGRVHCCIEATREGICIKKFIIDLGVGPSSEEPIPYIATTMKRLLK